MASTGLMMDDTEDVALNFGDEDDAARPKTVRHPIAVVCHLAFRIGAILAYLFCGWFSGSFIVNFVVIVLFLSMDFWTVKNISGRLLVGLRWWNHVDEDGKSQWIFESHKGAAKSLITNTESRIFWLSLVVCEVVWVVFFFGTVFTLNFKWFMVVVVGILLNGANLYGYIRCKIGAKKQLSGAASSFLGQQVLRSLMNAK
ncbi:Golgi apparatus membrane protein TVP23 homolog B-like isoform X2 [Lineus longissimus]|uniref:Golgi apparatus membrane protein TVP23 homolog B-like isoform X2 n=1 Tax=Lineus longissimus TaxID=88925 RepID=UPI002B4CDEC6